MTTKLSPVDTQRVCAADDAVHRRMTTTPTADLTPAEHQARLDALAEQSVRAAKTYGVPSPQHDAAMDAHTEYEWEHALEPETGS